VSGEVPHRPPVEDLMSQRLSPTAWAVRAQTRLAGADPERGDVPGWVMITIMTAGLVTIIWGFADDRLREILDEALSSVAPA
jgi:hypothetical protein